MRGGQGAAPAPPMGTPGTPGTSALGWGSGLPGVCAQEGAKDSDTTFSLSQWGQGGLWGPADPGPARCWECTPQSPHG